MRLRFGLIFLTITCPAVCGAQTQAETYVNRITFDVTSQLTLVDVTVTDGKGKPVHGLTQADFVVKEDGKPQAIKSFQEYVPKENVDLTLRQLPPDTYSNSQSVPMSSAMNVLLFDQVTTGFARGLDPPPPGNLIYAKSQAVKYLQNMPAGTQVAIMELTDAIRVVQGFTTDRTELMAAVNSINYKQEITPALQANNACKVANEESRLVLDGMDWLTQYLAAGGGRKNVIWFTPGVPWLTNYIDYSRVSCLTDYTDDLQKEYDRLITGQVSVYPIDPRALSDCGPDMSKPIQGFNPGGCIDAMGDEHRSMAEVASATGGAAFYNRNDLDAAIGEAIADGSNFYTLAYVPPPAKYDGMYHKISVEVDQKGLHLQYRHGYTSIDAGVAAKGKKKAGDVAGDTAAAAHPAESPMHAAMEPGAADALGIAFNVHVSSGTPRDQSRVIGEMGGDLRGQPLERYTFDYTMAASQFQLTGDADGPRKGAVELVVAAFDSQGQRVNILDQVVSFTIQRDHVERFMELPLRLPMQLDLPEGREFIRVGVRDVTSGRIGTVQIPVLVHPVE